MRGTIDRNSLTFDPEIERTTRTNRRARRARRRLEAMAENNPPRQTLGDYTLPNTDGCGSSIVRPTIQANNFRIKPALLQLVSQEQFGGSALDDPNIHLTHFLQLCSTIKHNGVSEDAIRLILFPFSLRDKAKQWLQTQPHASMVTWNDVVSRFLAKYFPPSKSAKIRSDITSFAQLSEESLYDAWERFKDMLRRCPHHAIPDWLQIHTFCNGLSPSTRAMVDVAARGSLNNKTPAEAQELIETMASNSYHTQGERGAVGKGKIELDTLDAILAQNKALSQQMASLTKHLGNISVNAVNSQEGGYDVFQINEANGGGEQSTNEQINYMGNNQRGQYKIILIFHGSKEIFNKKDLMVFNKIGHPKGICSHKECLLKMLLSTWKMP